MSYNGNQDDYIDAGEGIKPCGRDMTPASGKGACGSDGPGQDARIPAGEGIMPGDGTPFSRK